MFGVFVKNIYDTFYNIYKWILPNVKDKKIKLLDMYIEQRNEIIKKDELIGRQKKIITSLKKRLNSEIDLHNRNLEYIHSLYAMNYNEWTITDVRVSKETVNEDTGDADSSENDNSDEQ